MIEAKHNKLYIWFFRKFFGTLRGIHFRKLTIVSDVQIPENQSVLLFQNHFSWWDGYWSDLLSKKIFRRKFYVMMLEDQLRKRMFLNSCGVFSIQKNNRDFLNSLKYASEILKNPKNLVTIYPTGVMFTQHQQKMPFQKGINHIVEGSTGHFTIVLAVFLVDYFGFARPEIRIYLENYSGERTVSALEKAYDSFYQSCIAKQTE
ncbi:MAG: 1-acyl-sn-glycerol-3-phosphate acyltransferase [Prolixibacteraceae bacterium]|jgi:1-acyl-sn-glycerol-3-phosphate acyltransferase